MKSGWSDDELDIDLIDQDVERGEIEAGTQEEIVQEIEPVIKVEATTGWDDDDIIDI